MARTQKQTGPITMICEKTGIPFEAENRRRKSHPDVQAWLATAYEEGWYGEIQSVLYGPYKETFPTIEQFNARMEVVQAQAKASQETFARMERERKERVEAARRRRRETNDLLREFGYRWSDLGLKDEEEADAFDINAPIGSDWYLFSPDNRSVSVFAAMRELFHSDDVRACVKARRWFQEYEPERLAEIEKGETNG